MIERAPSLSLHAELDDQLSLGDSSLTDLWIASGGKHWDEKSQSVVTNPILIEAHNLVIRPHAEDRSHLKINAEILQQSQEHYDKLRSLGISVISFAFEERTDTIENDQPRILIGYSDVKAAPLTEGKPVPEDKANEMIRGPLEHYIGWCEKSGQKQILSDAFNPEAYAQHESGAVFLSRPTPNMDRIHHASDLLFRGAYVSDRSRFLCPVAKNS